MRRKSDWLFALAGSLVLALGAVVVLASPASAHQTEITGSARCQTNGEYEITWSVHNGNFKGRHAQVTAITPAPDSAVDGISVGTVISAETDGAGPRGMVTGTQRVGGWTTQATLTIEATWFNDDGSDSGVNSTDSGRASGLQGTCKPATQCVDAASAHFRHTFDGAKGEATVELDGDQPLCPGAAQDFLLVSYFAPSRETAWPQYALDHTSARVDHDTSKVSLKVDVPACYTQVDLVWGAQSALINPLVEGGPAYGDAKLGSKNAPGNRSSGVPGWFHGGDSACTEPAATFVDRCDGSVVVHLTNSGPYAAHFRVQATQLDKIISVGPAQSAEIAIEAGAGEVTVTEQDKPVAEHQWRQPDDCALPTMKVESTCDDLTVSITNPAGIGNLEANITYGTQHARLSVAPAAVEEVTFSAGAARTVNVSFADHDFTLTGVYRQPNGCESLPRTGSKIPLYGLVGVLLIGLGTALLKYTRGLRTV